ncbi:phospholipid carrier-dependent glycosyltransferase [Tessaracoccus sp. OS52]|uniref:dolichyl-phosphate-mannose--protein mannosyltransferase n=1 Tax=Tessaracoccus sp. OS52 TaxID=2886691 RepID=UPI001D10A313|nr:phospholipid carrier-dependent glycosyltransferase [Tessaracoccus sp. OS52]MCC2593629.1 phospholipid carrier-dependent glycosyltransferase [Tessaracoccus sp. OS52]
MTTVEALDDGRLTDRRAAWLVTLGITAFAFVLRLYNLGFPRTIMFDETYYAKDAYTIARVGYELDWAEGDEINTQFANGDFSGMLLDKPSFVVHPPLGKLLIGWGAEPFGWGAFGWRFAAAVFGALMVLLVIRMARRLSRSTLVGAIAGVLVTFDGLAFVMSRIALLDIFQATFAVAAVAALVADRDWFRHRLADWLRKKDLPDLGGRFGPLMLWRPWRIVAGIMFGASCAVKWNTVYMIAVFGILTVVWDLGARRLAGGGGSRKYLLSLLADAPAAFVQLVVVAIPVYIASWYRWLTTTGGYSRDFGLNNPDDPVVRRFGEALGSLWNYHVAAYNFHTGDGMKEATHTYEGHPAGWLVMARPIGIHAENGIEPGQQGCEAVGTTCLRVVSAMGTPLLWWLAAAALVAALWFWLGRRDWRFAVPVLAVASVWLPWFQYAERPLFFFYAIMIVPFTATGLAMVMGRYLGPANGPQRRIRAMYVGIAIGLVVLNFAFIYPVLTADLMTRPQWLMRMWFGTWI